MLSDRGGRANGHAGTATDATVGYARTADSNEYAHAPDTDEYTAATDTNQHAGRPAYRPCLLYTSRCV